MYGLLQAWELAGLEKAARAGRVVRYDAGSFRVMIDPHDSQPEASFAIFRGRGDIAAGLREVERSMRERRRLPRVELNAGQYPELPAGLERAGYVLESRHPLMTCRPEDLRESASPDVEVRFINSGDDDALLGHFLLVRNSGFSGVEEQPSPQDVTHLKALLTDEGSTYAIAFLDGHPAGSGVTHALDGVAEMVGVATLEPFRRRGVAASVSSALAKRHFQRGGVLIFLDASGEPAQRVYARLGFQNAGERVAYVKVK